MSIHVFGQLPDGRAVHEIRLANAAGARASILTFGAAVRDLVVHVGDERRSVVLGYDALGGYLENNRFLGVVVGRHASRIDRGRLPVGDTVHQLSLNAAGVHLHGGAVGFSRQVWDILAEDASSVTLGLVSPDGDDGYPGRLDVHLTYRLLEPATLALSITATTDAPTMVSLAQHSYFALQPGHTIRDHKLEVAAARMVAFGEDMLPTGERPAVDGTPYDFRSLKSIGAGGDFAYDCCFVLDQNEADRVAARLVAGDASLALEVLTSEPCLVFYDGAGLGGDWPGLGGTPHGAHAGLCLEPMRYPDNPNQPAFPSARLDPGEVYRQETVYRFG